HTRRSSHFQVLDDRQIGVAEAWSDERVSRQIPEMEHAARRNWQREDRTRRARAGNARIAHHVVEPLRWRSDDAWIADEIRAQRIRRARERAVADHDVERIAGLRLHDEPNLPSFLETVAGKRQIVDRVDHEAVAHVEVRRPLTVGEIEAVLLDEPWIG